MSILLCVWRLWLAWGMEGGRCTQVAVFPVAKGFAVEIGRGAGRGVDEGADVVAEGDGVLGRG